MIILNRTERVISCRCGNHEDELSAVTWKCSYGTDIKERLCSKCVDQSRDKKYFVYENLDGKCCYICGGRCKNIKWNYTVGSDGVYGFYLTCSKDCYEKLKETMNLLVLLEEKNLDDYHVCVVCGRLGINTLQRGDKWYCNEKCYGGGAANP